MTIWEKRLGMAIEKADMLHAEDPDIPPAEYDPEVDLLRFIVEGDDLIKTVKKRSGWVEITEVLRRGAKLGKAKWKKTTMLEL